MASKRTAKPYPFPRRSVVTNGEVFYAMVNHSSSHEAMDDFSRSTEHGKRSSETWMTTDAMKAALASHVATDPVKGARCATKALAEWEARKAFLRRAIFLTGV